MRYVWQLLGVTDLYHRAVKTCRNHQGYGVKGACMKEIVLNYSSDRKIRQNGLDMATGSGS